MTKNVTYIKIYGHIIAITEYHLWLKHTSDAIAQHKNTGYNKRPKIIKKYKEKGQKRKEKGGKKHRKGNTRQKMRASSRLGVL